MKFKNLGIVAISLAAFFAAGSMADEVDSSFVLKRIKERGVVNMGHREASVPFSYIRTGRSPISMSTSST
jgi:glutamate/aspartate transport system substrate-binding protein